VVPHYPDFADPLAPPAPFSSGSSTSRPVSSLPSSGAFSPLRPACARGGCRPRTASLLLFARCTRGRSSPGPSPVGASAGPASCPPAAAWASPITRSSRPSLSSSGCVVSRNTSSIGRARLVARVRRGGSARPIRMVRSTRATPGGGGEAARPRRRAPLVRRGVGPAGTASPMGSAMPVGSASPELGPGTGGTCCGGRRGRLLESASLPRETPPVILGALRCRSLELFI